MSAAAAIDVTASDTGLASCLRLARVSDATAALFIQKHKLESLEDFVYVVERASWETSLKELAEAVPELRGDRLVLARLKAAYEAGFAAVHNSQAVEKQDASDLDQPIPDNFFQQLDQEWKRSYNLPIEAHLDPCDSLRGRIWRELRRRTLTLLELRKVRSVIGGSAPLEEETISLDGACSSPRKATLLRRMSSSTTFACVRSAWPGHGVVTSVRSA